MFKKIKMKQSAIVLCSVAFFSIPSFAQSVADGVNHIYAERFQSAKSVFEKLVAANPKNLEAVYWLGQSYIDMGDVTVARGIYEKTLVTNSNAPLVLVGIGHVELLEGKAAEARQHFETAISLSKSRKGEDPNVLNAIACAHVDAYTEKVKRGDLDYAISKLNDAAKIAPTNAAIFLTLGDAYRKKHNGGQAIINYMKATQINPSFAQPLYRMATLYKTQQNWDVVTENLNKAIAADPKFAPAYLELYDYYLRYVQDFSKAEEYANKFVSSADPSFENDYIKAQTAFVRKKYDEAISVGKNIVSAGGEKVNPRVFRLLSYSHVEKGDSAAACQYVGQFFAKAKEEQIAGSDYILQANACGKNDPAIVMQSYTKAVLMDSVLSNQVKIVNEGIDRFKSAGQKIFEADLRLLSYQLRQNAHVKPDPTELIHIAIPYYLGGNFQKSDSIAKIYINADPESFYGYLWSARSLVQIDTAMQQGIAVPVYAKLLEVSEKDKERCKAYGVEASNYLADYTINIKKDKAGAISYYKKALEFDPTDATAQNNLNILTRASAVPARRTQNRN